MKKKIEDDIANLWKASGQIPSDKAFFDCLLQDPAFYDLPAWQKKITAWKEACKKYSKTSGKYVKARANLKKTSEYLKRGKQRRMPEISIKRHEILHLWNSLYRLLYKYKDDPALIFNLGIKSLAGELMPYAQKIPDIIPEIGKILVGTKPVLMTSTARDIPDIVDTIISKLFYKKPSTIKQMRKDRIPYRPTGDIPKDYKELTDVLIKKQYTASQIKKYVKEIKEYDESIKKREDSLKDILVLNHRKRYD